MDGFRKSCFEAAKFPSNLIDPGTYNYSLQEYVGKLDEHQNRLFCDDESKAAVDVWELEDQGTGGVLPKSPSKPSDMLINCYLAEFRPECIRTADQVRSKLRFANPQMVKDPLCRFM